MLRQIKFLLVASFLLFPIAAMSQDNHPETYKDKEAYQVYSAIVPMYLQKAKALLIQTETNGRFPMCLKPNEESQKVIGEAMSDYQEVNKKTWLIQEEIKMDVPYKLESSEIINAALNKNGLNEIYPSARGYIELSAVGFNADKTIAIVFAFYDCGGLCGQGNFHVLQKKDGKWIPLTWKGIGCIWQA